MKFFEITKILIANRGEIACRIMRTCKLMNIATVAVYSDADRNAMHVRMADEKIYLGASPSKESYLQINKIIEACKKTGAQAVHPGYGFLSENPVFARLLKDNNIILIGPSPEAMDIMGGKISAKQAVAKYNVPMVPGMEEAIIDVDYAKKRATEIGFPILIKASAGGGGKGMRIVESLEVFDEQMKIAVNEAEASFGDGSVFIEKFVTKPRHIEIQILADNHGNVVYLNERECSIQRRHQKLVEEAPSVLLTPELRKKMGESAVFVSKACNYSGVGTVEFLVDADLNYFFLEMNTRLQVEHPITELITGVDLVEQQIEVARNKVLSINQNDISINGHAIELRVCAEDARNNFLPEVGVLEIYKKPDFDFVRVDDGIEQGMEIPVFYDSMISKLIVHAPNRSEAIEKMKQAIMHYHIVGVSNTLDFGAFVMNHKNFIEGDFDTNFIKEHFDPDTLTIDINEKEKHALASLLMIVDTKNNA